MLSIAYGDIFNDLRGPLPGVQGHRIFEIEYLNVLRTKLL